jgi:oligopeptidase B
MTTLTPSPADTLPEPPVAKRVPRREVVHGETRVDDYFWMRDRANPDVAAYLEAENVYTEAVMAPRTALRQRLYDEMLARIQETDMGVPWRKGAYLYYSRTEQGKQYPTYCRRRGSLDAAEELVLDMNALAEGHEFLSVGAFAVTDDARLLAYSTDFTGYRQFTLQVKDLTTGAVLPLRVERVTSVAWAKDDRTLFYTVEDEGTKRPCRLYRHVLGSDAHDLVLEEKDEAFNIGVGRTRSGDYLVLGLGSHTTSEARFLRADDPAGDWRLVAPRVPEQEYDLDHRGDVFWIRTNDRGRNFRLVTAPVDDPRRENWAELVPHRADTMIEGVDLFRDHAVVFLREGGLSQLQVMDLRTRGSHRIAFPEPAYAASPGQNEEWESSVYRYVYESFTTPRSVFDYDLDARSQTLLKEQPVLGGYDRTRYAVERVHATAQDGVRVPISLVYRKDLAKDGRAPIYLSGYGSYGIPNWVGFTSNRFSLVDRGVVVAIAHIRGGGELGKPWHDAGRMQHKMNTFTDFIACAEHLLREGYGSPQRLVIQGGSAGGLLMGAVTNLRPDLWKAVVSKVPFLDVINSMLDETLPLTVGEFEEWGNPKQKDDYDVMRGYCPYSNLEPKAYPAILVTTSFNDSQVMYWEPAKYVARLRTLKTDANPLLLKTNMAAGHGGASGRYDYLREVAFDYAFMLWQMGITE